MRLALIFAATAPLLAVVSPPPNVLPDGTYRYEIRIGGTSVGSSTIVVRRRGDAIEIDESALMAGRQAISTRILDRRTFLARSYRVHVNEERDEIVLSASAATLSTAGAKQTIKIPAGIPFALSDNMPAGFATIPLVIGASGARRLTLVCACGAFVAVPVEITGASPGTLTISVQNQTATLRYDPATEVLQQFDLPAQDFRLRLESHDSGTAPVAPPPAPTAVPLAPQNYTARGVTIVADDGVKLAATLTLPDGKPPFPGVLLVHGSGCIDRDETIGPNKVFAQIANNLSNAGYAVLRYDKRSCGKSGGTFALRDRLIADARDALGFLGAQREIDGKRVYVLGHSEGGELAPSIAAADKHLRGIVLLAPPAIPLESVLMQQLLRNVPAAQLGAARRRVQAYLAAIASGKGKTPSDRWLRSSFGIDPARLIARVPCPILVVQGTKDMQVRAADTPRLTAAARAAHRNVTVVMLEGDDHLFIRLRPNERSTGGEYFIPAYLDPRLFTAVENWLRSH